ncbi:MAG: hypothetical protein AB1500_05370 [Bacillota bacterium]
MVLAGDRVLRPLPRQEPPIAEPRKKYVPALGFQVSGLVIIGFFLGLTVILCQARIISVGFNLQELQRELAMAQEENQALDGAIQRMVAPDKIEAAAVNRLGMVRPPAGGEIKLVVPVSDAPAAAPVLKPTEQRGAAPGEAGWLQSLFEVLSFKNMDSSRAS